MNYRATNRAPPPGNSRALLFGANNTNTVANPSASVTMRNNKKDGASSGTMSEQARMIMEEQNNREISALSEKVAYMKNLATDIEAAIQEDQLLLEQTGSGFDRVTMMMKGTLGNVNKMLSTGGSKHMCYLVSFVVCLFLGLYWLMK